MEKSLKKLTELIDSCSKILITSHIGPDGDSVSSCLLLSSILTANFPDKTNNISMEEVPYGLSFLPGIKKININPLAETIEDFKPDLLFFLDANNVSRVTRTPAEARDKITIYSPSVIIIDHHEKLDIEQNDLYINDWSPAVTLNIYDIFLEKLSLKKPKGYAQVAMTGIYTDTGGFVNRNLNYAKTFEIVPKLIADGADVETIANELNRISEKGLTVFKEFMNNLKLEDGYTYSFISDITASDSSPEGIEAIKQSADLIRSGFLKNVGQHKWGFIVYKDCLAPGSVYSASFRALTDNKDVSAIARKLGGGGHKPAAGAKFEAASLADAISKVLAAITE